MGVKHITDATGPDFICKRGYLMSPRQFGNGWNEHYFVLRGSFLRKRTRGRSSFSGILPKSNSDVEYILTGSIVRDIPETPHAFEVVVQQPNLNHHGVSRVKFLCQFEAERCAWVNALHLAATQKMAAPEHLVDIVRRMLKDITCTDRRSKFRVYKQCFRGNDAMAWLVKEETDGNNYAEAYHLASQLSGCGLVYHVTHKRDLCDSIDLFRASACVGDSSVAGNANAIGFTSIEPNGAIEEEVDGNTDSELEDSSSNGDALDLVELLDITYSALETPFMSVDQRMKLIESDLSRIQVSLAFVHVLLILLGVWLLLSSSFERVLRSLPVSEHDTATTKAEVVTPSNISPSSQLDGFRQPALEEESDRETETELLPAMDTLSVGRGAESRLVKRKISESSISSDMLSESHRGDALAFLPPPSEWEQWPVLFRISPIGIPNVSRLDCSDPFAPIRINDNVSVPFETPLFCGRVIIRMAGLPNAEDYFHGRKRLTNLVIQGQFRRPVAFYSLLTGQKFSTEVNALPRGLARVMAGIIKKLQPTVEINLLAKSPFWLNPVVLTAQALQVEQEGKETDIHGDIKENTILLGSQFSTPISPARRKKYFSRSENLKGYYFQPGVVWTFDFYQHIFDAVNNRINAKIAFIKPHTYLGQQPITLMAVDTETGEMACRWC